MLGYHSAIATQDWKKIRYTLQDFTSWYRRKNVSLALNLASCNCLSKFSCF